MVLGIKPSASWILRRNSNSNLYPHPWHLFLNLEAMSNPASWKVFFFFWNLLNMLFNLSKWFKMTVTIQAIQSHRRNSWGLERRLDGWRHLLFLQKTWMWSPAHTWWLQTSVPLVTEGPMLSSPQPQSSFDLHSYYTHNTYTYTQIHTHTH